MKEIETEIQIDSSPGDVWDTLIALDDYAQWNPFIRKARGPLREGSRIRVEIQPPDARRMTFLPRLTRISPPRELEWIGGFWVRGLFDGRHRFEIKQIGPGRTHVWQSERFTGVLVPLAWRGIRVKTRAGFEAMNKALKRRVEDGGEVDPAEAAG